MRVLVACEFSAITRDAFAALGHDAWSCDLVPSEKPGNHIQGDAVEACKLNWDLVIGHPPCTYLTYAGTAHWNAPGRAEKREEAMDFFMKLYDAPCPRVCIENPFGLPCQAFRRPDQTINPFDFGEPIRKRTCLWLRGLPRLAIGGGLFGEGLPLPVPPPAPIYVGTRIATGKPNARYLMDTSVRRWHHTESISGSKAVQQRERCRSFKSIANAMATQWGKELSEP